MPLSVGDRLGPYEILAPIGAGGMGEVYRARDTKLGRDVALKVLPSTFAFDPGRMGRFEREARVLASLNHSNIATLYGLEESDSLRALVMELVEGPTLADRIAQGPMPLEEAVPIALQMIEALDYAHDRGVIHRDLKPANVKLTPEGGGSKVKLLDFGLARAMTDEPESPPSQNSPTLTLGHTQAGVILGTAAYMSPEQVKGKRAERRADVWAFGVVLYEMLTAKRLFDGETTADILSSVMKDQPPLDHLPARVRPLVERCLQKDPRQRMQAIGEARIALEKPLESEGPSDTRPQPAGLPRKWLPWAVAGALAIAAAVVSFVHFREQAPVAEVMRFEIPQPEKVPFGIAPPTLSPDGRKLAFVSAAPQQLWVRSLDTLEARPLAGTEGAVGALFWSPDSRSIAFWTAQPFKLKRIEISGGPAQTLCDTPGSPPPGTWNRDGVIVFSSAPALARVSEAGGECTPVTKLDTSRGDTFHRSPSFLPDGRHFVYFRQSRSENTGIYVGSLEAKPDQQSNQRLMASESGAVYVPSTNPGDDSKSGYLLFLREGTLMARPFNPDRLQFSGDAIPIAEHVASPIPAVGGYFSASATGALAYRTGVVGGQGSLRLTWLDRQGKVLSASVENLLVPGPSSSVALSSDGGQAAFTRVDVASGRQDLWLYEFARETMTRFTFGPAQGTAPVWSPDGKQIVFASEKDGGIRNLYRKASNNAGTEELLFKSDEPKVPSDWSRDGRFLLFTSTDAKSSRDIWYLPMSGATSGSAPGAPAKPEVYLKTEFGESEAKFSPDGRFVAYTSNASGAPEVYVQPFPDPTVGKWMVSRSGGTQPAWRRDGKELFYLSGPTNRVMAVEVSLNPVFKAGIPKGLFDSPPGPASYDVSADGQKFIKLAAPAASPDATVSPITIVLNWQVGLKK